jgi:hypothetical protein
MVLDRPIFPRSCAAQQRAAAMTDREKELPGQGRSGRTTRPARPHRRHRDPLGPLRRPEEYSCAGRRVAPRWITRRMTADFAQRDFS